MAPIRRGRLGRRVALIKDCRITNLHLTTVARGRLDVSLSF